MGQGKKKKPTKQERGKTEIWKKRYEVVRGCRKLMASDNTTLNRIAIRKTMGYTY